MLLAIDIGNTNIVAGVFAGDTLVADWRVATDSRRMSDEYIVLFDALLRRDGIDSEQLTGAIVAGVVPLVQTALLQALRKQWRLEPLIVSHALDLGIEIRYSPPTGVGADRIANAVAAVSRYGTPSLVVDFGTTTNFDAISTDGAYVGGAIAPGLEISQQALVSRTAQLPNFALEAPPNAIGTSTVTSLQSGILLGYAGLVDRIVEGISAELGEDVSVIATGGLAGVVAPHTRTVKIVDPNITLEGLRLIYERNRAYADGQGARQN